MNRKIDLDALLTDMGHAMDFNEGDKQRIWATAASKQGGYKPKLAVFIPIAAACILLVTVFSIAPARAAVLGFFDRVFNIMDYLNMDKDRRPENTAVSGLLINDIRADVTIVEHPGYFYESAWVNGLKASIDEFLYDGQSICVKYTVDGTGIDGFTDETIPTSENQIVSLKNINYPHIQLHGGKNAVKTPYATVSECISRYDKGILSGTVRFCGDESDPYDLTGRIDVELTLDCLNVTNSPGKRGESSMSTATAGTITFRFTFDADSGKNSVRIINVSPEKHYFKGSVIATESIAIPEQRTFGYVNRVLPVEGCSLSFASAVQTPVETKFTLRFEPSKAVSGFAYDDHRRDRYLRVELLDGDTVVGYGEDFEYSEYPRIRVMVISAPFLSENVKRLRVRAKFIYISELYGQKMEVDKPVVNQNKQGEFGPCIYGEMPVEGGTFEIVLP